MGFFHYLKQLRKEHFTFVVIPHSGKGTKQFQLNKFLLYSIFTSFTVLCISLVVLFYTFISTKYALHASLNHLHQLQEINEKQALEISELKNRTSTIHEKLNTLGELEQKIRSMVGLKMSGNSSSLKPTSRSFYRNIPSSDPSPLALEDTDIDLDVLAAEMDSKIENLAELIHDVDGQLKAIDALPDAMPAEGKITSKFGYRISPFTGRRQFHHGIDIANDQGTDIVAAGTGIVTFSGWNAGYGKTIIISHGNGYRSVYAHNSENLVEVGQKVKKGDMIAKMGNTGRSTGPHLHFEIHYKGEQIDPENVLKNGLGGGTNVQKK